MENVMPNRDFNTKFWTDPWVRKLKPLQAWLFIYTWTNDHCLPSGMYHITIEDIAHETKLTTTQVRAFLPALEPKVYYDEEVSLLWVRNFVRDQKRGDKFLPSVISNLAKIKPHHFLALFADDYKDFAGLSQLLNEFKQLPVLRPYYDRSTGEVRPYYKTGAGAVGSFGVKGGVGEEGVSAEVAEVPFLEPLPVGEQSTPTSKKKTNPDHRVVMDFYFKQFQEYRHVDPYITGKDAAIITRLLSHVELEEIKTLLIRFFESEDKFILNSGYGLGVFESQITKLRLNEQVSQVLGGEKLWLAMGEKKDGKTEGRKEICAGDGKDPAGAPLKRIEDFN